MTIVSFGSTGFCRTMFRHLVVIQYIAMVCKLGAQQLPPMRELSSTTTCSRCRIVVQRGPLLELLSDSLSYGLTTAFAHLANGNILVRGLNETSAPALLDSAGHFVRMIARVGDGPGEIRFSDAVVVTPSDTFWVLEPGRKHVFSPSGRFVRDENLRPAGEMAVGPDGSMIIAAEIETPGQAGYPLHFLSRTGNVIRSFGVDDPSIDPIRLAAVGDAPSARVRRLITQTGPGHFWVYNQTRFLLEQYDFSGRLIVQARHTLDGWFGEASLRRPGRGEYKGMGLSVVQASNDPRILWLIYEDRNSSFGQADYKRSSPRAGQHDLVIEALEISSLRVAAVLRIPATSALRIDSGRDMIAVYERSSDGFDSYRVHRLTLIRQ